MDMTKQEYIKAKELLAYESKLSDAQARACHYTIDKWEFANQRVIEELELLKTKAYTEYLGDGYDEYRKIDVEDIYDRIKELKQK